MKRTKGQRLPATTSGAENGASSNATVEPTSPQPTIAMTTASYRVALPHGPQSVIDGCTSPADAYERYRCLHGILQSDFVPKIELLDDGAT